MARSIDNGRFQIFCTTKKEIKNNIQQAIADSSNEIWLSPISIWEAAILAEKGRIFLQPDTSTWVSLALKNLEIREAALNNEIALLSREIDLPHQDPADRFIAAIAVFYQLTLATVDSNLTSFSWLKTVS